MVRYMSNNRLIFKHIDLGYHKDAPILSDVDFSVPKGAYCAVIGANGSGKSTLLKLVAGLMHPLRGVLERPFKRVAYLPQNGNFNRTFPISVADVLKMGKFVYANGNYNHQALSIALSTVKLNIQLDCPISNLSGGQFQRVLFARILLQNPDLLLLDEPFNGIDEETILDLASVLADLHVKGKTILLAVHDWHFVNSFVPMVIDVQNGKTTLRENQNLSNS
jgi:zinc/manganese transport system ATP-binding protein